jgi:hypothetical protein
VRCPICEQSISKKPIVFQKRYFPRLPQDQPICKNCYESRSEEDIYDKLAPGGGEEKEEIKRHPVIPYASGHKMAQLVVFLLGAQIFVYLAAVALPFFPIVDSQEMVVELLGSLLFFITGIVFLMWLHRAHRNLPALILKN